MTVACPHMADAVAKRLWTEFQDPAPDRLVGDIETALRQQVFNVPVAQRKAQGEPDGVPYHIGREVVTGVRDRRHRARLRPIRARAPLRVTMPDWPLRACRDDVRRHRGTIPVDPVRLAVPWLTRWSPHFRPRRNAGKSL